MPTTRRDFLQAVSLGGACLILGVPIRGARPRRLTAEDAALAPNPWIRIDSTGRVTLVAHKSEMGQGVRTSLPMILADELGADWRRIEVVHARPGPPFPDMQTSGSGSVEDSWRPLRLAAAAAREMLVAAAAARWNASPGDCRAADGAVVHERSGRRLTFGALAADAAKLPVPAAPRLKDPSELRLIGQRVPVIDLHDLVSGRAVYAGDIRVPGMRSAVVARNPAHGKGALRWDDARARAVPGVERLVQISSGIAIVARDTWSAIRGRDALGVEWEPGDGAVSTAGIWASLERALDAGGRVARSEGNLARAMAGARHRMAAEYRWPFQAHAAVEPLCCVADVRPGRCEIWAGTQAPNEAQAAVAKLLGLPAERVSLHVTLLGGGFGRRLAHDYILEAVEISRAAGVPVRLQWTREDDIAHDMYQSCQVNRLAAGLDDRGRPVAWHHQVGDLHLSMFGPYNPNYDPAAGGDPWGGFDTPYGFDGLRVELALVASPVPTGAWRSVTYPPAVMARECFLDEIANAFRRDPVELRLALIPSPGRLNGRTLTLDNGDRLRRVLSLAAERSGWRTPLPRERDGRRWGRGIACNAYHQRTMVAQVAEVSVGAAGDVRVHRVVCAVDCGQVINRNTLDAQVEGGVAWGLTATLKGEISL
ncbi:MAG TPA: molybdopterin cofactor-binding domain-containing protein, partial [Gemmatimonadales bacterium]|nr:molybdopterin cofactor-binding domain-containing protein [Gemmatimonadales bacterium]